MDAVAKIAATVLYEGYVLWPYRRSATKNQKRWTFGGVYPPAYSEASGGVDPWYVQTECLVRGAAPVVGVQVRFLHIVARQAARRYADGTLEPVDALQAGPERYLTWDEATEREVALDPLPLTALATPWQVVLDVPAGREEEPLVAPDGTPAGALVRSWEALTGTVEVAAREVEPAVFQLRVRLANRAADPGRERERALRQTLVSTHVVLRATAGEFVSLTDPPADLARAAARCENVKLWPVLVGEAGERNTLLAAPIILPDYPQIAPESPGDLFDGTEIDQMLVLNVLTLTDAEKAEMRASDPRAREILERTEALTLDDFMNLHGAIRDFRLLGDEGLPDPFFGGLERPAPTSVRVGGVDLRQGSRVRLRPRPGADVMDVVLAGRVAFVEGIEQDYEDRIHLAVTLADDPGRDLGIARQPGHRFFFAPDEVEPLDDGAAGPP
ncbi:MAG TPA: hypothetical protein VK066_24995 [Chloroflexota bacterium]|nr:hypothetical protein [Chloroflexota bacterium]